MCCMHSAHVLYSIPISIEQIINLKDYVKLFQTETEKFPSLQLLSNQRIAARVILRCKTAHIGTQNGPFRKLKRSD